MQAVVLFALFGFFFAVVGGIIAYVNTTTQQLRLAMVAQTTRQFAGLDTLITRHVVPDNLESPSPASGNAEAAATYLCKIADATQVVDCTVNQSARDPWHRDLKGWVFRQSVPLYTQKGLLFTVPVTTYALLSPGPDGIVQTTYADGSPLTRAPDQANRKLTTLVAAGDDILQVFSDLPAQQNTANAFDTALGRISLAAQRNYLEQFYQFKSKLEDLYGQDTLVDSNGLFDITGGDKQLNAKVMNLWKTKAKTDPDAPSFGKMLDAQGALNTYALGVDGDIGTLQRTLPGGGAMILNAQVGDSGNNGVNDVLLLSLTAAKGTPWQQQVKPKCTKTPPVNCMAVPGGI
jgi:hypothetical protein